MSIYNRWFQLGASVIAMVMIANLQYAWTLFVPPIQEANGWPLKEIQLAFTLFILFQTWVQPLDGWLVDRLGPRGFITVAGLMCGLGWAGMGYADSIGMLYATYCLAGIGAAFVYSCSIGSALKWFKERRGLASGIMAAGFGGGTALFIPIISWLIRDHGYQYTFIATGLLQGLVIVIVAQFLRHPPAQPVSAAAATAAPRGAAPTPATAATGHHYTTGEMLQTPRFYLMYSAFVLMATGGLLVTANTAPMARSWGLSAALITTATLGPLANAGSRIFWGWASDRLGRETTMVVAFSLQSVFLAGVALLGQQSGVLFAATIVLVYFTWGEIYSLFPSASADYFGTRHATSNYAVLYTAKGVAAIGSWIGVFLYERTGTWEIGCYGSAVMALIAAGIALRLRAAQSIKARAGVPATA